jgi:hypothetical protein
MGSLGVEGSILHRCISATRRVEPPRHAAPGEARKVHADRPRGRDVGDEKRAVRCQTDTDVIVV